MWGQGREQEDLVPVMVTMQASDGDSRDQVRRWRGELWLESSCYSEDGATRICRWISYRCWLRKKRRKSDPQTVSLSHWKDGAGSGKHRGDRMAGSPGWLETKQDTALAARCVSLRFQGELERWIWGKLGGWVRFPGEAVSREKRGQHQKSGR